MSSKLMKGTSSSGLLNEIRNRQNSNSKSLLDEIYKDKSYLSYLRNELLEITPLEGEEIISIQRAVIVPDEQTT